MKRKIDNLNTEKTLLNQKKNFHINGGISECIKYENKFLFKSFDLVGKDLIEFGCGVFPSSIGLEKNKMPKTYIATDTSKKIISNAKINDDRPIYRTYDLEKNFNIKKKFDFIVLKGVLHHTKKPEKVLKKLKKLLKKNGIIIISEPNLSSILGNFLKWFLNFCFKLSMEDSPYGQYNFKKINNCINSANLKIIDKWYSVLLLLILTGDYGRIMIFPDNKIIFRIFTSIENFFFYFFKFIGVSKFLNFKINLVLKDYNN